MSVDATKRDPWLNVTYDEELSTNEVQDDDGGDAAPTPAAPATTPAIALSPALQEDEAFAAKSGLSLETEQSLRTRGNSNDRPTEVVVHHTPVKSDPEPKSPCCKCFSALWQCVRPKFGFSKEKD